MKRHGWVAAGLCAMALVLGGCGKKHKPAASRPPETAEAPRTADAGMPEEDEDETFMSTCGVLGVLALILVGVLLTGGADGQSPTSRSW